MVYRAESYGVFDGNFEAATRTLETVRAMARIEAAKEAEKAEEWNSRRISFIRKKDVSEVFNRKFVENIEIGRDGWVGSIALRVYAPENYFDAGIPHGQVYPETDVADRLIDIGISEDDMRLI